MVNYEQKSSTIEAKGSYNIATIRNLLRDAFTPKDLRRFCEDRSLFAPMLSRFPSDLVLEDMIDVVIEYCQKQGLLAELLEAIKIFNPRQYEKYADQVGPPGGGVTRSEEVSPKRLLEAMQSGFGASDFELLCFDLGVSTANLGGQVLSVKMMSLIEWHQQRGTYAKLVEAVLQARPHLYGQLYGE